MPKLKVLVVDVAYVQRQFTVAYCWMYIGVRIVYILYLVHKFGENGSIRVNLRIKVYGLL